MDETNSEIESRARALLEGRMSTVRNLEEAHRTLTSAREQVTRAERDTAAAWAAATDAGWTPNELRQLGFTPPRGKSRTGTTRRRSTSTRKTTTPQPSTVAAASSA